MKQDAFERAREARWREFEATLDALDAGESGGGEFPAAYRRLCVDLALARSRGFGASLVERLNQGRRVAVFAEGGIRPGDHVKVFHARLFKAAVEADCMIQPAMIRYMRKGKRDPDMTFINGEHLVGNMLRMLGRPTSDADLQFLSAYSTAGRPRRDLARQAQAAVTEAYNA